MFPQNTFILSKSIVFPLEYAQGPVKVTSGLKGKAYEAVGQAGASLHTMHNANSHPSIGENCSRQCP